MSRARACRVCGCTEHRACTPPCWWVEWDLCSACAAAEAEAGEPGDDLIDEREFA